MIITSTDVESESTVYYTPDTHPNVPIVESVRESSSIPLYYCPVLRNGCMYVDGGLLDNYPIQKLYDYLPKDQVFGIKLISNKNSSTQLTSKVPTNVVEYMAKIIKMLHNQAAKVHIDEDDWKRTIKVNVGSINPIDFNLNIEQKNWLVNQGEIAAKIFFKWL